MVNTFHIAGWQCMVAISTTVDEQGRGSKSAGVQPAICLLMGDGGDSCFFLY